MACTLHSNRLRITLGWVLASMVSACALLPPADAVAAVTAEQREQLESLHAQIKEAANLYKEMRFADSAKKITAVEEALTKLVASKDAALVRMAKPVYASVQRAHQLLEVEGIELKELPSWEKLTGSADSAADASTKTAVSFQKVIAPIFVGQCANCHINNKRGQFSMASFADLMRGSAGGTVILPGESKGSRLIEVIESGDMPRGSGKVSPENLSKLRRWIDEGAKFDGSDQQSPLLSYVSTPASVPPVAKAEIVTPTGKETLRFSKNIAPVLLENCSGCHIGGRRPGGNLSMDTFTQFRRGGDSGDPISPGKADESLIIKKLKGIAGNRMPAGGRPPLSSENIELIATWIREGSAFDGVDANANIKSVADQAWAATASQDELFAKRQLRAMERWHKVLPDIEPTIAKNNELVLFGNVTETRLQGLLAAATDAMVSTRKILKVPTKDPLVRGGMVIFVFKDSYDYSEFGRMTENRQLLSHWRGHWRSSPVEVYGALVDEASSADEQTPGLLLQIFAGAYMGSFLQSPAWFAEGIARNLVASTVARKDPRVMAWQRSIPTATQRVDKVQTLLNGKLDDETAALVGMGITNIMMDRSNRKRFDALLNALRGGQPFTQAVTATYAPPDQLIKSWLGIK